MAKFGLTILLLLLTILGFGQKPEPTDHEALLKVTVTDLEGFPSYGEIISFVNKTNKTAYEGITDIEGKFEILVPKGYHYIVQYRNFGYDHQYAEHEIPAYSGKLVSKINIKYRLPSKTVLENVSFLEDRVTLDPKSYPHLNKLVELLKVKQTTKVRVAGHTAKQGSAKDNLALSESQAEAVKNYLINNGVEALRVGAIGYGGKYPLVDNTTAEGRIKNQRIEIEIVR